MLVKTESLKISFQTNIIKVLINPKWFFGDPSRAKKVS